MSKDRIRNFMNNPYILLLSFVLTIVGTIVSIVSCFISNEILAFLSLIIVILCVLIFIIYTVRRWFSYKQLKTKVMQHQGEGIMQLCDHFSQYANSIGYVSAFVKSENATSHASLKVHLNNVCEKIKKCFELLFQLHLDEKCSFGVCIKEIKTFEIFDDDPSTWSTQTIARACENYTERSDRDDVYQKVSDNTSFFEILETKQKNYGLPWVSRNLEELKKNYENCGKEYRNPDSRYLRYYKSTIVVPIKQKKQYVSNVVKEFGKDNSKGNEHYLAFLCIDSSRTFSGEEQPLVDALTTFATIFAQLLYPFLEEHLVNMIKKIE